MSKHEDVKVKTEMVDSSASKDHGQVRVRSNVTDDAGAWHLVPGELAALEGGKHQLTDLQREEANLYKPCCICHRSIVQIEEEGCDRCHAMGQEMPTRAEAQQRRLERTRRMAELDENGNSG